VCCILYTVYCLLGQAKKAAIQSEIKETDRRIDTLVYELYGLTKEEIGIVEEKQK
jgi:type II restriction/modification system DNA methylase subunit YeeA